MHLLENRVYAIKEIVLNEKEVTEAKIHNSKVLREIQLLSALSHPNIVKYYTCWFEELCEDNSASSETWSNDNTYVSEMSVAESSSNQQNFTHLSFYIQMEFCENKTLYDFIELIREPISGFIAFKIINDILKGLKEIHKNNIIHRDLKLANKTEQRSY